MSSSAVARRYAAGAFRLAEEEHAVDRWRAELAKLDQLFQDEGLRAAFRNPAVSTARRVELARRRGSDLRPQTQNLMRLLIEHQRTSEQSAIRREFERMADQASGIVHATLTTSIPLEEDERQRLRGVLQRKLGREVILRHQVDPALIGGARIQVGDQLVDGSVQTKLEQLRQALRA